MINAVRALFGRPRATQGGADEDPAPLAPLNREVELRVRDGLPGGNQGQLADAIEHSQPRLGEMCTAIEANRGSNRRTHPSSLRIGEMVHAGPTRQEIRKQFVTAVAERRHHAQAGNRDTAPDHFSPGNSEAPVARDLGRRAMSRSMYPTTSLTVTKSVGVSSAILTPKRSSILNMSSSRLNESIFSVARVASELTSAGATA